MRNKMFSIMALAAVVFMNSCGNGDTKNENESTEAAPQSMIKDTQKMMAKVLGNLKM